MPFLISLFHATGHGVLKFDQPIDLQPFSRFFVSINDYTVSSTMANNVANLATAISPHA